MEMMMDLVDHTGRQSLDHNRSGTKMMRASCGRNCWHCWTNDRERLNGFQRTNTRQDASTHWLEMRLLDMVREGGWPVSDALSHSEGVQVSW